MRHHRDCRWIALRNRRVRRNLRRVRRLPLLHHRRQALHGTYPRNLRRWRSMGGRQCVRRKRADVPGRRLRPVFYSEQLPCGCERLCDARLRQQPHLRLQRQGASDGMRRRGWKVRRRWAVQRLHAGNRDLQRERPSFVRLEWSVCPANCVRREHVELRPEHGEVRGVLDGVAMLGGVQRMLVRDMYEQHLRLRAEKPGNGV